MAPKSILKKTVAPATANEQQPMNQQHLDTAIHHANIIAQRKLVEDQVLRAIIELMDFPPSPEADSRRPWPSDAIRFRELLIPFQPADYDSLIEERNILGKCGYTLCPRDKRRAPSTAKKHLIDTPNGVQVVDRKALEVWCSDDCARRALYVKVQLNEEPAWLRQAGAGREIELLVENKEEQRRALPLRLKMQHAPPVSKQAEDDEIAAAWAARGDALADLALERGEKPNAPSESNNNLIQAQITERVTNFPPMAPALEEMTSATSHLAIEGHIPKANRKDANEEDEEDDPQDWDRHLPG